MSDVIRQQDWDEDALRRAGFERYDRKKTVVMARALPDAEAPKTIHTRWGETIIARQGYMICYNAGAEVLASLDAYEHWPVEPTIFEATYRAWDEPFQPDPAQQHLLDLGCHPYYKAEGVWAKPIASDIYIQSLEDDKPILVPEGRVLAIGKAGEPYAMTQEAFAVRYDKPRTTLLKRLLRFFSGKRD